MNEVVESLTLPDAALAADALKRLGPEASRWVWMILMDDVDESLELDMTEERYALLLNAVESWPAKDTLAQLKTIGVQESGIEGQAALLEMLSVVRSPLAIGEALERLEETDPILLQSASFKHLGAQLVQETLEGSTSRQRALRQGIAVASGPVCELLSRSIDARSHPAAPQVLASLADRHPSLELPVLRQLLGIDAVLFGTDDRPFVGLVHHALSSDNPLARRVAAQAAGRWKLPELFLDVVDALDDPDAQVRSLASGSLRQMSGLRRTWGPEQWQAWYGEESRWLESAGSLHEQILGMDAFTAASACTELSKHALMASATNEFLRDGLSHDHPRVRMLSVQGLAASGHSSAVLPLISALDSSDQAIESAALQALKNISGQALPAKSSRWRDWWTDLNSQGI